MNPKPYYIQFVPWAGMAWAGYGDLDACHGGLSSHRGHYGFAAMPGRI